jgi:hypothetical protein
MPAVAKLMVKFFSTPGGVVFRPSEMIVPVTASPTVTVKVMLCSKRGLKARRVVS